MEFLEIIKEYVRPELLVLAVVLYFIGKGIKNSETIKDKYIPIILGIIGVIISGIYVVATSDIAGYQSYSRISINTNDNIYISSSGYFGSRISSLC